MKNKSFSKKIVIASVAMLIVISTAAASIMSGCGDNSENTTKPAINSTSINTESKDETVASTEPTTTVEKSEDETKNSETNTEKPDKQDNDKNSTDKNSSDKNTTDKNSSSSSNKDTSPNTTENNNSKTGVATIAGKKYNVGDTVTATYIVKCPEVLVNYEGEVKYDTNILKLKDFKMHKPASTSAIYNKKIPGRIPFNGSEITEGYDYTKSGNFMTVTYEVVGSGNTTPNLLWKVATGFDMTTNTPFAKNNKPTNGLTIDVNYK